MAGAAGLRSGGLYRRPQKIHRATQDPGDRRRSLDGRGGGAMDRGGTAQPARGAGYRRRAARTAAAVAEIDVAMASQGAGRKTPGTRLGREPGPEVSALTAGHLSLAPGAFTSRAGRC